MIPTFTEGTTALLTWPRSFSPDAPPTLAVIDESGESHAMTVVASGPGFIGFIATNSAGIFVAEWSSERTLASSAYDFVDRSLFGVRRTEPSR